MKFDLTITISVIVALTAIISPVIVALINNSYQLKMKKLESYDLAKRNAFERFSKAVGTYISYPDTRNKIDLGNAAYGLLPYFKIDLYLFDNIINKSEKEISQDIYTIIKILREQL